MRLNTGLADSQAWSQGWRALRKEVLGWAGQGPIVRTAWSSEGSCPPPARGAAAVLESKGSSPLQLAVLDLVRVAGKLLGSKQSEP